MHFTIEAMLHSTHHHHDRRAYDLNNTIVRKKKRKEMKRNERCAVVNDVEERTLKRATIRKSDLYQF